MQNMFYINICVDTQKFKQQHIYMNEQKAKEMYCPSRLTEGPKDISPPFITLNILLGNFLSVQSVKPLLVNMAQSNAIESFLCHG